MTGARHVRRWLSAGLALALAGSPVDVGAAPARAKDELNAKISALAQEAQTRYETADFAGAIELWTQAYAALPDDPAYDKRRNVLAYQIAQACVEAYALDPQLVYLRKAERLFDNYLKTLGARDKGTIGKVQGTLEELREKIHAAEEQEAAEKQAAAEAAARSEVEARDDAAPEGPADDEASDEDRQAAAERDAMRSRSLTIAGGALAGVGAIFLGVMGYGLARGARIDRDGQAARADGVTDPEVYRELLRDGMSANRLAIASAVVGGVVLVTGIGLLGAGAAGQRRSRQLGVAPTWLRGGAGLVLQGRF